MLSSNGFFILLFFYAYTKYIWIFSLAAKPNVFIIFHQFQAQVER
jgi:hypothetical protein